MHRKRKCVYEEQAYPLIETTRLLFLIAVTKLSSSDTLDIHLSQIPREQDKEWRNDPRETFSLMRTEKSDSTYATREESKKSKRRDQSTSSVRCK